MADNQALSVKQVAFLNYVMGGTGGPNIPTDLVVTRYPQWQAKEFVFYKLMFNADPAKGPPIMFDPDLSGRTRGPGLGGMTIQRFLQAVQNGTPPKDRDLLASKEYAPHIRAIMECYVVVQLDNRLDWYFQPLAYALQTQTGHGDDYLELRHVRETDKSASYLEERAPGTDPTKDPGADKCRLIYFAVRKPVSSQPNGDPGRVDLFSYLTQFTNGGGGVVPLIVDPDIKNNGGDTE